MKIPCVHDIKLACEILRSGRIVALPTGTSYGLAADALQGNALQRLRQIKKRLAEKSFTVFLAHDLWDHYFTLSTEDHQLLLPYLGKHVTVLLPVRDALMHIAVDGMVGLRMIDHPLMEALANEYRRPLTATSANMSDQPPCFDPESIQHAFANPQADGTTYDLSIGCILDAGVLPQQAPSTILSFKNSQVMVIRPGAFVLQA